MKFVCDQDWNSMKITNNGRYCTICKKEVFNLTNRSAKEIHEIKTNYGELCGQFNAEQIEPDLIAVDLNIGQKFRYIAASVATFLGLELSSAKAQTQNETPTVQTNDTSSLSIVNENIVGDRCMIIEKEDRDAEEIVDTVPAVKRKHKYYLSKRFPFIKKRRRRVLGALF